MSTPVQINLIEQRNSLEAKRRKFSCWEVECIERARDYATLQSELQVRIDALDRMIEQQTEKHNQTHFVRMHTR